MGASILTRRVARLAALAIVLVGTIVGCDPDPTGPGTLQFGPLRLHPVLQSAVSPSRLDLDAIHVTMRRADDGTLVSDTILGFDAAADDILAWVLGIEGLPTTVSVEARVQRGGVTMFAGTIAVEVVEASPAIPGTVHDMPMEFVGPGADAVTFTVTPTDVLLTFGESVQFQVEATDADGNPVADPVVVWSSSDPDVAPIGADARLEAPATRSTVEITAQSPTGVSGAADARFQPSAVDLVIVSGDGTSAPVAETVTFELRVIGTDGLGVEGVTVTFDAPPGATLATTVVESGADGSVSTVATLGTSAGAYVFGAIAEGLTPVALSVTAEPGPPAALAFGSAPPFGEVGQPLIPAVTVVIRDAFDNPTGDGTPVSIALGTNPAGATLSGAGSVPAVDGVARFDGLTLDRPGSGFTLVASAAGLPDAESDAFAVMRVPRAVTVTPDAATLLALEQTVMLTATALDGADQPIPDQTFVWSSSDEGVAVVDQDGVVTAIGNGTATVTAQAGDASGETSIVVRQEAVGISVTPDATTLTALDATVQLVAAVVDANGFPVPEQSVTWSSLATTVAEIDQTGLVTALANGSATLRAARGDISGTAVVTVRQEAATVSATPNTLSFDALQDQAVIAHAAFDANGNVVGDAVFTWSSDADDVATVDQFGAITAIGNGNATITVRTGEVSAEVNVAVEQVPVLLQGFPDLDTLFALGEDITLTADARDANGFIVPEVLPTWTTLTPAVASVTPEGVATTLANGDARFVAALGELADTVTLTVEQRVAVVVLTPEVVTFDALGASAQLTAEGQDANGFPVPGTPAPQWSSDLPEVASVDGAGTILAQGNGETAVRAQIGEVEGLASVTVRQVTVSVTVTPNAVAFDALQDQTLLTAVARDANGFVVADADVSWSSGDDQVASVDAMGTVTAEGNGSTDVTATADGVAGAPAEVSVQQVPTALEVTPGGVTLAALAEQVTLVATARDANGFAVPGVTASWSSLAPAIATVDQTGLVTAQDNGTAAIEASADDLIATATITVRQIVTTVSVAPPTLAFTALGASAQLTAEASDANGFPVPDAAPPVWSSDLPGVAAVDGAGQVTAEGNGETFVRALVDGAEGTAAVTVRQRVTTIALTVTCPSTGVAGCDTLTALGDQAVVAAESRDANGFLVPDPQILWTSLAPGVASVDDRGVVTAVAGGSATIRAEVDDAVAEIEVIVHQAVAALVIEPADATLTTGQQLQLTATGFDANGFLVPEPEVAWTALHPLIASVTADGLVTAHSVGGTVIEANADGTSATAVITVE